MRGCEVHKVVVFLVLISVVVVGGASDLLDEPGELVGAYVFENGSALAALHYGNGLILTYLDAGNAVLGTSAPMYVPLDYTSLVVEVCGGYAQVFVTAPWNGKLRTHRRVWELPEKIQENYLPVVCW
jgi:hypothetical protein